MAKYDGWIAKDKYGDFWHGSFRLNKGDTKSSIVGEWSKQCEFKVVKVKFVEVK